MTGDRDDGTSGSAPEHIDLAATLRSVGLDRQRLALWAVAGLILLGLWTFAWTFVGVLVVGLFVYYVTRPLFARIHSRIPNRTAAIVVSLLTVALPTLLLVGWTLAVLVQTLADFLRSAASDQLIGMVEPYVDVSAELQNVDEVFRAAAADPRQFTRDVGPVVSGLAAGLVGALATLGTVGLQAFIVLVITFYLLRDDVRIAAWARRTFASEGSVVETYLVRLDRDLENIFFGNILNALATGLIAVVSFTLLNVVAPAAVVIPRVTLIGLLVGVASLVPAIGIKLVTWPLGAYLLARSALVDPSTLWFPVAFFLVSFVVVDYIPDQLLRPYVSGRSLHVGAVMLAYLFGPILFGWYGIFLGPLLLAAIYEFGIVVLPWLTGAEPEPPPVPGEPDEPADGEEVEPIDDEVPVDERPSSSDGAASTAGDVEAERAGESDAGPSSDDGRVGDN